MFLFPEQARVALAGAVGDVIKKMPNMKIRIEKINGNSAIKSFLNPEIAGHASNGKVTLSGWAYSAAGVVRDVVVKSNGTIFKTGINIFRQDVERHLQKMNFSNISQPLGYKFDFLFTAGMELGYEVNGTCEWIYRLHANDLVEFRQFDSITDLLDTAEGVCGNVYFHNADDWSKIIVMFNGALTPGKVAAEKAIFQRWSWAKHFKHPVAVIADPLTIDKNPIHLGWYLGATGRNALPEMVGPLLASIREKSPDSKIVAFGSSGGGFAAIGGTLLGLFDEAIAINPQVDVLKFEVRDAVDRFMKKRGGMPCDSDLKSYKFSRIKACGKIRYVQNRSDHHHFEIHYRPFRNLCLASDMVDKISFTEYDDEKAGHMPPHLPALTKIVGEPFSILLKKPTA